MTRKFLKWIMLGWLLVLMFVTSVYGKDTDSCGHEATQLKSGELDLSCWNREPFLLKGKWRLDYQSLDGESYQGLRELTQRWRGNQVEENGSLPALGAGRFDLTISTLGAIQGLALEPGVGLLDYQVSVRNAEGEVKLERHNQQGYIFVWPSRLIHLPTIENGDVISLYVSNKNHLEGGVMHPPSIGDSLDMMRSVVFKISSVGILIAAYGFLCIYSFYLWSVMRHQHKYLAISIAGFTQAIKLSTSVGFFSLFLPSIPQVLYWYINWIALFLTGFWLALLFRHYARFKMGLVLSVIALFVSMLGVGLVVVAPAGIMRSFGVAYGAVLVASAILLLLFIGHLLLSSVRASDDEGEVTSLVLFAIAVVSMMADAFLSGAQSQPEYGWSAYGILILLGGEAFVLVRKNLIERQRRLALNEELLALRSNVEARVQALVEPDAKQQKALKKMALSDSLTGLANRPAFEFLLKEEIQRATRFHSYLSVIMIDIDNFKQVNDLYGHQQGDVALMEIAKSIRQCLRRIDTACRYGGDEYAVLLPDCSIGQAMRIAENIRLNVCDERVSGLESPTVSLGVARFEKGDTARRLMEKSDRALLTAKSSGRNQVSIG